MSLSGIKVLVVEPDPSLATSWRTDLHAHGADVSHFSRAGKGLEALLLGGIGPAPHGLVVLGPGVARSMQDAFRHTLVGSLASCRLAVVHAPDTRAAASAPQPTPHGADVTGTTGAAVVRGALVALGHPDPESSGLAGEVPSLSDTLRILLVEDNPVNLEVAEAALVRAGLEVHAVFDGQQALNAVRATPYDAVVMDIQMPTMDGITATRHIRALPPPVGEVPIVALTANALPTYRQDALNAGMNAFVVKPVRPELLVEAIQQAIAGEPSSRRPDHAPRSNAEVLDLTVLKNLQATFGPALARVQATLARDAPRRLQRMRLAVENRDFDAVGREAHSLKSSSGTFGLVRVSRLSREIEAACTDGHTEEAARTVGTLAHVLDPDLATLATHMS